ncbi:MAG: hypothetical protein QT03_C0001G0712 [archaeon GW2011_AR10]|nr:MAG: hypothetical protein QT03_C0001G0712 [archaeon GW2011_AR10]
MPGAIAEFVEFSPKNLKGYTIIEGFPGMGLVGTIAAKYMVEKVKFRLYGYIDSDIFMPIIRVHKGLLVRPARIYVHEEKKLVVLISEQAIPKLYTNRLAKEVVKWIQNKGITELISLSGIHAYSEAPGQPIIYGIAANEESVDMLKKFNLELIQDGITTGITAMILMELKRTNIKGISILGNVKIAADYQAAAEVLKKLNELLSLKIDVKPLLNEAKEVERELLKQLQTTKQTKDSAEKFEPKAPMYT